MEGAVEIQKTAERLLELAQMAGEHAASSPALIKQLRVAHHEVQSAAKALMANLAEKAITNTSLLHEAQLEDCMQGFRAFLDRLESDRYASYDVERVIVQLASELLTIAHAIAEIDLERDDTSGGHGDSKPTWQSVQPLPAGIEVPQNVVSLDARARRKKERPPAISRLTNDDERKTISFSEAKRRQLTKRRDMLIEQYQAASEQLSSTLNGASAVVIKKQIASLEQEIRVIEQELESLDSSPK